MKHLFIIKDGWWILAVPQTTVQGGDEGQKDRETERERQRWSERERDLTSAIRSTGNMCAATN